LRLLTKPPEENFLQQQGRFDEFVRIYNHERPHQAIAMRYPAELYTPSLRPYAGLPEPNYPFHDMTVTVTECGRLYFRRRNILLSEVFAGQNVGVREVADQYASGNPRLSCRGLIGQSSLQVTDREVTDERDAVVAVEAARGYSGVVGRACEGPAGVRAESGGLLQGPRPRSEVLYPLET
jgi:hypothetical protein